MVKKALDRDKEFIDHYRVLCLPTNEEGSKLTIKQIKKAYHDQCLKRHPDKRPDDPKATSDFQRLKSSFEILRDVSSRAAFDARLRSIREEALRASLRDAKRRKLASDLKNRERAARKEKMAEFQARNSKKTTFAPAPGPKPPPPPPSTPPPQPSPSSGCSLDLLLLLCLCMCLLQLHLDLCRHRPSAKRK
ncbi:hypothetical protein J5N97_012941 [Dioscorea zingiberensis]|uniref:J domain-containing protein n=1 Tax=Dioscorea zingiberensis TaxID=325984 RepID=A0A9D5CR84_9LILI|nr:hypothetical protein J5N97_012941 [Dioscorea zingiberensis]